MYMHMPKILFSDLDGTLLDDQKEVEQSAREAIRQMLTEGHYFSICTGRPLASAKLVAKQFHLDGTGCYIVAYNGGTLYDPGKQKLLSYASIPHLAAWELIQKAEKAGFYVHTYKRTDDTVLASRHLPELDYYTKNTKLPYEVGMDAIRQSMVQDPPKVIVASLTDHEGLKQFQEENADWTKEYMKGLFSCDEFLEYNPIGVSKGSGLKQLCDYLHVPVEASVAAGDERNDIAMLQAAGISAVPANAHPSVRGYADYICEKDNNEGAVGEIIRQFMIPAGEMTCQQIAADS